MTKCSICGGEGILGIQKLGKGEICSKCKKIIEQYPFIDWDVALKMWKEAEEEGIKMDRGR